MSIDHTEHDYESNFVLNEDGETLQATVLAAAIEGDIAARGWLPSYLDAFEEPYRTVAAVLSGKLAAGDYVDRQTIPLALEGVPLMRPGMGARLTPAQVINLLFASEIRPGQVEAYLPLLEATHRSRRQQEWKDRARGLVDSYGDQPEQLLREIETLVVRARSSGATRRDDHPCELMEIIPFMQEFVGRQQGTDFVGLDSGFTHLNAICNGLDTGLLVLAAPPGFGKTTWAWQVACQVAETSQVPVLFVTMEQSKDELRAKALARLSKLQYRHILRGRLRADDPADLQKLLDAARTYAMLGRNLTIIEGDDTTTVESIAQAAAAKSAQAGSKRCLVVIDYLQILPTRQDDTARVTSTRDRVDLHLSSLRRMARKLCSPVLAISAENRAGYRSKGLDVFKESGGIEYSADVAMILGREKTEASTPQQDFQPLELTIVKNRNGERGVVKFRFYAKRAEFVETGRDDFTEDPET